MSIVIEPKFTKYGKDVVDYLNANGRTPGAMLRILQRLNLPLPSTPDEAVGCLVDFLDRRGTLEFKAKMGLLRSLSDTGTVTKPATPQPARQPSTPSPGYYRPPSSTPFGRPIEGALSPQPPTGPQQVLRNVSSTPAPTYPQPVEQPVVPIAPQVPEVLRDIPPACLTEDAVKAARDGRTPFGAPPLIDRRSGVDRRSGHDRRENVELVFRNSRFGGSRRRAAERRSQPPKERRPEQTPVPEVVGSPVLRAAGWVPPAKPGTANGKS